MNSKHIIHILAAAVLTSCTPFQSNSSVGAKNISSFASGQASLVGSFDFEQPVELPRDHDMDAAFTLPDFIWTDIQRAPNSNVWKLSNITYTHLPGSGHSRYIRIDRDGIDDENKKKDLKYFNITARKNLDPSKRTLNIRAHAIYEKR